MQHNLPETIGVAGAGAMGAGIAEIAAASGIAVLLFDARPDAANAAIAAILGRAEKRVLSGKLEQGQLDRLASKLKAVEAIEALGPCEIIIEAIVEDLEAKRNLFAQLEDCVPIDTVLATNTSSLPIGVVGAKLTHPERFAGLHFFNPVPLMKLVEIIPGPRTAAATMERLTGFSTHIGKEPVTVRDTPGFLVNLGGRAFTTEALAIVQESVATPSQIDAIMRDCCGFRMGPFELMDLTGMDVNFTVSTFLHQSHFADPRLRSTPLHRYMLETGQLGRKTGRGFYLYGDDASKPAADMPILAEPAKQVVLGEESPELFAFAASIGVEVLMADDGVAPILAFPLGEDVAAYALRLDLDLRRIVAVDLAFDTTRRVTLMSAVSADAMARDAVAAAILGSGRSVTAINDSTGFVAQRIVAMIANLGCEMAQMSLAAPGDIDKAMRLGLNYPLGPLEWAEKLSPPRLLAILRQMQGLSGDDRYRPSAWLRRRADHGLSIWAR
ncbi:MAG: 3-hydroxyacyl-CoA dehydrogenase [Devosia sp.]|nr:3-hydroxyacyl-CoA dehydrogenase [Devosia sp.]